MREWTINELINRIHCWKYAYTKQVYAALSMQEKGNFEEDQDQAEMLIIQILEEKIDRGEEVK